ncbi:MAG TPA: hypothetical protein RMG45_27470, partial [Polyangiaceae bacterium LLY-WYZ-15_(1-7)]|nr:hypothetical protein [Polyangiaceae bacterium LLY-WYZ-15_(1-7)]
PASSGPSSLGTNLSGVIDWSKEEPFVNVFKMARPFVSGGPNAWADERELPRDEHGWIQRMASDQVAHTLIYTDNAHFRPGRYVVRFEGSGEIHYAGAARRVSAREGEHVLELRAPMGPEDLGIGMDFVSVDPADPIRNLRVLPPGGACAEDRARFCDAQTPCPEDAGECLAFQEHEDELRFHPDFLARIQRYGMLRFMDWMGTNGSEVREWADRPQVEDATWSRKGVPLEVMIQLTNELEVQPWFCIPHLASDEYVRRFAEQVRDGVDPERKVWIEYSNEIWNAIFPQGTWAEAQGEAAGLGEGFQARLRYQAQRSSEIFAIFEEVLGAERLVRVLGSQANNTWATEQLLEHDGLGERVDAIAIAPYFGAVAGPDEADAIAQMSVEELIAKTREEYLPESLSWVSDHAALAERHGLELVAYEAGQHFVGVEGAQENARMNALFDAINRHEGMGELYAAYLEGWVERGGGWLNHFVNCDGWSKHGRWGALEWQRQPREASPKFDALMTFIERHPNGW